jgi:HTH-type transcriptional regulator/antitoxin HigA
MPVLKTQNLNDLPTTLIRARIVRGLSQRKLAEALGVKEQQVQRYESERYASASLSRLVRIASVLGLTSSGVAEPGPTSSVEKSKPRDTDSRQFAVKQTYGRKKRVKSK